MDLPEMRLVRRVLEQYQLDPVVALAVVMRAMTAEHVERLGRLDADERYARDKALYDDAEPEPVTILETLHRPLLDDVHRIGEYAMRHQPRSAARTASAATLAPAVDPIGDLYVVQDEVRDLLATCLDAADNLHDVLAGEEG